MGDGPDVRKDCQRVFFETLKGTNESRQGAASSAPAAGQANPRVAR